MDSEQKNLESTHASVLKGFIDATIEKCAELIVGWTKGAAGDICNWFSLMERVISVVQTTYKGKLTGIQKAEVATGTVIGLAQQLWDKWTSGLSGEERLRLKCGELKIMVMIMDNPEILNASTPFLKRLLNYVDRDRNGEITAGECKHAFCWYCCCCCI